MIYQWSGFDVISPARMPQVLAEISSALADLDSQFDAAQKEGQPEILPYKTFNDDVCLARFLKGIATRELYFPTQLTSIPANELIHIKPSSEQASQLTFASKQLSYITMLADKVELDHWILPYSRLELGQLYMRLGKYSEARRELGAAMTGGYADDETGIARKRFSMENALHFRAHNCLVKLNVMERLLGIEEVSAEGNDAGNESE